MKVYGQLEKAQLENLTADPATVTAVGYTYFNTATNQVRVRTSSGWSTVGSSASNGVNYVTTNDGENDTSGWILFADGSSLVDGVGGSPTATFARSTTAPIRGTGHFLYTPGALGNGVGYAFTIDSADKNKMLSAECEYEISTYASYTDGDVQVWIYDVTNGVLIQPGNYKIEKINGVGKFVGNFQTSSSTSYRLVFFQSTATTTWTSLKIEGVRVGPQSTVTAPVVTDWKQDTAMTLDNMSGGVKEVWTRRVGSDLHVRGVWQMGTSSAGTAAINLPGLTVDSSKITAVNQKAVVGLSYRIQATATNITIVDGGYTSTLFVEPSNPTKVFFGVGAQSGSLTKASWGNFIGNSEYMSIEFSVPVLGWASSITMNGDADARVCIAQAAMTAASSATANTTINFTATKIDTHGVYSAGSFTCPVSGYYEVAFGGVLTGTAGVHFSVFKNGTWAGHLFYVQNANVSVNNGKYTVKANAGDILTVQANATTTMDYSGSLYVPTVTFTRVTGPSQVTATAVAQGEIHMALSGIGSTNTNLRFDTVGTIRNVGNFATLADSATDGTSVTITTAGVYGITAQNRLTSVGNELCVTKNSLAFPTMATANQLGLQVASTTNANTHVTVVALLGIGDVIRAYSSGGAANGMFKITKIS